MAVLAAILVPGACALAAGDQEVMRIAVGGDRLDFERYNTGYPHGAGSHLRDAGC